MPSANVADGRKVGALTRADIEQTLREYAALYGDAFTSAAFNPSTAKWRDDDLAVERYYAGNPLREGAPWPSLNTIVKLYGGSFNAARVAAGFAPNRPGPSQRPRRADGEHAPVRDIREHRVVERNDRQVWLAEQARRADVRADRAEARAARAEARIVMLEARVEALRVRAEVPARAPRVRAAAPAATAPARTRVKIERVRDERAENKLRGQVEDLRARLRASEDQARATTRDLDRARLRLDEAAVSAAEATRDARDARREAERATDLLAAGEARAERLRQAHDDAVARASVMSEAAATAELVAAADRRADEAEVRAARAEREMREQAAAITGEQRRLTAAELGELRASGPSGPTVLGAALKELARARSRSSGRQAMAEALTALASAAVGWRDQL